MLCTLCHGADRQGHSGAASMTLALCQKFKPGAVVMVGMAASSDKNVQIGTVFFVRTAVEIDLGGITPDGNFKLTPNATNVDGTSLSYAHLARKQLEKSKCKFEIKIINNSSGNQVMETPSDPLKKLLETFQKIEMYDMEIYSAIESWRKVNNYSPDLWGAWKGIADHMSIDERQSDKYENQTLASNNAFICVLAMVQQKADGIAGDETTVVSRMFARLILNKVDRNVLQPFKESVKKEYEKHENDTQIPSLFGKYLKIKWTKKSKSWSKKLIKSQMEKHNLSPEQIKTVLDVPPSEDKTLSLKLVDSIKKTNTSDEED